MQHDPPLFPDGIVPPEMPAPPRPTVKCRGCDRKIPVGTTHCLECFLRIKPEVEVPFTPGSSAVPNVQG